MINTSPYGDGSLTVAAGGFEATGHPEWVIEQLNVDSVGLVPSSWGFCSFYEPEAKYIGGEWQNPNTYYYSSPVKYDPVELRKVLNALRTLFTHREFRMVMRVEMQIVVPD